MIIKKIFLTLSLAILIVFTLMIVSCSEIDNFLNRLSTNPFVSPPNNAPESISEPTGYEELNEPEPEPVEAPVLSQLEMDIAYYELLVQTDTAAANYKKLAALYNEAGMVRKERDILERNYLVNNDPEAFELLQEIVVNILEESNPVQEKIWNLRECLSIDNYQSESVSLLTSNEWYTVLLPILREGKRNYYLEDSNDGSSLYVEVGYDELNSYVPYTKAWYTLPGGNEVISLFQTGNIFQLISSGVAENEFDGDFTLWLCVVNSDTIYYDTGTFRSGVIVGDFISKVYSISEPTNLYSLFSSRYDVEYLTYIGSFDENGKTKVSQPARISDSQIAYALSEDGKKYLYYDLSEEEDKTGFIFDCSFLGLSKAPDFERYSPVPGGTLQGEILLDLSKVEVRVYNSVIQWFDGTTWHDMGSVVEHILQDPYGGALSITNDALYMSLAVTSSNGGVMSPYISRGGVSEIEPERTTTTTTTTQSSGGRNQRTNNTQNSGSSSQTPQQPSPPQPPPLPPAGNDGTNIEWTDPIT